MVIYLWGIDIKLTFKLMILDTSVRVEIAVRWTHLHESYRCV